MAPPNLSFLLFSLLFYGLFQFIGLGLALWMVPQSWRRYTLLVSPVIGFILMALASWYFYLAGFKGTNAYGGWLLVLAGGLLLSSFLLGWRRLQDVFNREVLIVLGSSFLVVMLVSLPLILQPQLTAMTLTNNDLPLYALANKIMQTEVKGEHRASYFQFDIHNEFGSYVGVAFFCTLTGLDPAQVQMINIAIFVLFSLQLLYLIARLFFDLGPALGQLAMGLTGLSPVLLYVVYQGFVRQIVAGPILFLLIAANLEMVRQRRFREKLTLFPLIVAAMAGVVLSYNHTLVIVYGLIGFYLLLLSFSRREWTTFRDWTVVNLMAFATTLLLSPQWLPMLIRNTFYIGSVRGGWFIPWLRPEQILGVYPLLTPPYNPMSWVAGALLIAWLFSTLTVLSKKENKETFFFSLSVVLLTIFGGLTLSLINALKSNEGFGGYNHFKLLSQFSPLLLLVLLLAFNGFSQLKSYAKIVMGALIVALCLGALVTSAKSLHSFVQYGSVIPKGADQLRRVVDEGGVESINIPAERPVAMAYWNIMWEAYYLYPLPVFFEQTTYYAKTPLKGAWWLVRQHSDEGEPVLKTLLPSSKRWVKRVNEVYSVCSTSGFFRLRFGDGWASPEFGHRWTQSRNSELWVDVPGQGLKVEMQISYRPLQPENGLDLYLDGQLIKEGLSPSDSQHLTLHKGENRLVFQAWLPPVSPGAGDDRRLGLDFKQVRLKYLNQVND